MMPMYAAHIGSMLTGLRRTYAADLGNAGLTVPAGKPIKTYQHSVPIAASD